MACRHAPEDFLRDHALFEVVDQIHVNPIADECEDGEVQQLVPLPGDGVLVEAALSPLGRKERVVAHGVRRLCDGVGSGQPGLGLRSFAAYHRLGIDCCDVVVACIDRILAHVADEDERGSSAKRVAELIPVRAIRINGLIDFSEDVDAIDGEVVDLVGDKADRIPEDSLNLAKLLLVGGS